MHVPKVVVGTLAVARAELPSRRCASIFVGAIADSYKGTFDSEATYQRGDLLTHSGSLWLAVSSTKQKPGHTPDWRLIVKKGDAK